MNRLLAILMLVCLESIGATYYIDYSGGSDANNGTTKATAWQRHPYMQGWAGTYTHSAGDSFIFKGGAVWSNACFQMTIAGSGTLANRDYYGIDATWYIGGSWARPVFDCGSTALTSGLNMVYIDGTAGRSNLTFDSIEMRNLLISDGTPGGNAIFRIEQPASWSTTPRANNITLTNCWIHKWTRDGAVTTDTGPRGGAIVNADSDFRYDNLVLDHCTIGNADGDKDMGVCAWGWSMTRSCTIHDAPNLLLSPGNLVSNDVYNAWNSFDATSHENLVYGCGNWAFNKFHGTDPAGFHGVMMIDTSWKLGTGPTYYYGNLFYDLNTSAAYMTFASQASPSYTNAIYFWNNTIVSTNGEMGGRAAGPVNHLELRNNHVIAALPDGFAFWYNGHRGEGQIYTPAASLIESNTVLQSVVAATSQGYTRSNLFQPVSSTNSTVNAGSTQSAPGVSPSVDLDILGHTRIVPWDVGAYELPSSGAKETITGKLTVVGKVTL